MKNKVIFPFVLIILFTNYIFMSCEKNTQCKATVRCVDNSGIPIQNASVLLYANVKTSSGGTVVADIKANGVTDAGGAVTFTFKLPAIYDIAASTTVANTGTTLPTTNTLVGTGIIKLEEGKGVEKVITLK